MIPVCDICEYTSILVRVVVDKIPEERGKSLLISGAVKLQSWCGPPDDNMLYMTYLYRVVMYNWCILWCGGGGSPKHFSEDLQHRFEEYLHRTIALFDVYYALIKSYYIVQTLYSIYKKMLGFVKYIFTLFGFSAI